MGDTAFKHHCSGAVESEERLEGNYFVSTYPPFSTWSENSIADVERALAGPPNADEQAPLGLYIHIPFCVKRCEFCYYLSYAGKSRERIDEYATALIRELSMYRTAPRLADRKPEFIYFGGGTPSLLSASALVSLFQQLQAVFPWKDAREVTFECAPQTVTPDKMAVLRDAGVTRVSLGVQQLDDDVLRSGGRVHLVADIERAYAAIRDASFDIVNLDLMVGMVGETEDTFFQSLERIIEMRPESVTIYQLEIPRNTPLYLALCDGKLDEPPASWAVKRRRQGEAFARLEAAGYTVRSAYAAVREPQRHPFVYQDAQYHGADLLGIGAASFSYLAGTHFQNIADLDAYIAAIDAGASPIGRAHALADDERLIREFVLQLKLGAVEAAYFRDKFGIDIAERFAEPLARFAGEGWLTIDEIGVRLTRSGLLRVDRLIPAFYLPQHRDVRYS